MTKTKPHVKSSVVGVIFNDDRSQILLIKRRDVPVWVIPGGGIDPGEAPEAAMIREFFEETGLTVAIKRQVAFYTPINRLSYPTYLFECSIIEGKLTTGNETQGLGFFALKNLPEPIFFIHQDWIEDARVPQNKIIQKSLSQVTYFNLIKYFLRHPMRVLRLLLSRCGIPLNNQGEGSV